MVFGCSNCINIQICKLILFCENKDTPPSRPAPAPPASSESNVSSDFSDSVAVSQDEPGLIFTGEILNGRPVIKGGNIEKLVERLTFEKYNGKFPLKAHSKKECNRQNLF